MDTHKEEDGGRRRGEKKEKKTSSVSIATETSLALPKMVETKSLFWRLEADNELAHLTQPKETFHQRLVTSSRRGFAAAIPRQWCVRKIGLPPLKTEQGFLGKPLIPFRNLSQLL